MIYHALSLKQPWATLLVHGLKTIEVRRWSTAYRGELLIHAARIPDERPQAWTHVPSHLLDNARLEGGILGVGTLTDCKRYRSLDTFVADGGQHLNDPTWFEPAGLFGFCFRDLRVLPFRRVPGYVRIFELAFDDLVIPPLPSLTLPAHATPFSGAVLHRVRRLLRSLAGRGGEPKE